ncbi:MAG: hypothetical protein IPN72_19820 [Saprospiraceae bacterium]|nr:hypothetical protein [Saprospiraceae bacterium]
MKIAIVDFGLASHPTYVESITKIYHSAQENIITIYLNERDSKNLAFLIDDRTSIITISKDTSYRHFLNEIAKQANDRIFFVTMEVSEKDSYKIAKAFLKTEFKVPVHLAIHNASRYFETSLLDVLKRFLSSKLSISNFGFEVKKNFIYTYILSKIRKRQIETNGKFIVISDVIKTFIAQYHDQNRLITIPFSVFENNGILPTEESKDSHLRICLPGYVSQTRRDYFGLMKMLESNESNSIKENITWDFLGGIPIEGQADEIVKRAKDLIAKGYKIILYEKNSVSLNEFDEQLNKADLILGNLMIDHGAKSTYGKSMESGLPFSMIKKAKPCLMIKGYNYPINLQSSVVEYSDNKDLKKDIGRIGVRQ